MKDEEQAAGGDAPVAARGYELGVGLFLMVLAVLVIVDSLRVGAGWADDGPKAGYFPFYIGVALLVSSGWIVFAQLRDWKQLKAFADRSQLRSVAEIGVPMVVYAVLIKFLGIYLASALLLAGFMWRHGDFRVVTTAAVSVGVPLTLFMVFERWFIVPLPKGPIEALFGL